MPIGIIAGELSRWGWTEEELGLARKIAPGEMAIAARLRRATALTLKWIKMPGKTGLDWAGYICYQRIVRVSLISERVAGWLWLTCLLGLLGVWDLSAKVPSSCLGGKTLPSGCALNLNNNNGTATRFTVDTLNQLTDGPTSPCTNATTGT